MENTNCYFIEGHKCLRILSQKTADSLCIESDDKIAVWHDGDLFLAYNPRTPEGAGEFLSYDDLRCLATHCLHEHSFHRGNMTIF